MYSAMFALCLPHSSFEYLSKWASDQETTANCRGRCGGVTNIVNSTSSHEGSGVACSADRKAVLPMTIPAVCCVGTDVIVFLVGVLLLLWLDHHQSYAPLWQVLCYILMLTFLSRCVVAEKRWVWVCVDRIWQIDRQRPYFSYFFCQTNWENCNPFYKLAWINQSINQSIHDFDQVCKFEKPLLASK